MKIVGLTGGIGSGKSTVAHMFLKLGVPVYIADIEAKKLTNSSKVIRKKLIELLGEESYVEGSINSAFVANKIFNNPELLQETNKIIHPKVAHHFSKWVANQEAAYCIKESALLFENGGYKACDLTILVISPLEIRIARVMARDNVKKNDVLARIKNQWEDAKKIKLADIVIENIHLQTVENDVLSIHNLLVRNQ